MIKLKTETKYRFVFKNGYTHDFWFSELNIKWKTDTLELTSLKWKGRTTSSLPFHLVVSDVVAIIVLGKTRSRIYWE